jgi:hypothetical protein
MKDKTAQSVSFHSILLVICLLKIWQVFRGVNGKTRPVHKILIGKHDCN